MTEFLGPSAKLICWFDSYGVLHFVKRALSIPVPHSLPLPLSSAKFIIFIIINIFVFDQVLILLLKVKSFIIWFVIKRSELIDLKDVKKFFVE